jgi:hypothetical protein
MEGIGMSNVAIFVIIFWALYFVPILVARRRQHETIAGIAALNILLGWTFIGWVVALVWALSKPPKDPSELKREKEEQRQRIRTRHLRN